jgi:uncharacterized protein YecT (DUF1311 family)
MRRILCLSLVFAVCALASNPASAEDKVDCANAVTTADLNSCAAQDFDAADAALNAVYKKIISDFAVDEPENAENNKKWIEALRVSQRAWVAFRDADCDKLTAFEAGGGSATTGAIYGCLTEMTQARTKDLKARYEIP